MDGEEKLQSQIRIERCDFRYNGRRGDTRQRWGGCMKQQLKLVIEIAVDASLIILVFIAVLCSKQRTEGRSRLKRV